MKNQSAFVSLMDGHPSINDVGGKGINLYRMIEAGFGVPPAMAVTVSAYDEFLDDNDLRGKISEILDTIDYDDGNDIVSKSAKIREIITSTPLPSDIPGLDSLVDSLRSEYFAVRSSAIAEDQKDASFAGQQDTYLNVKKEDIPARIKDCWASYWNDRAVKYRHDANVDHLATGIAVVIQKMVSSEISGVMFTANPLDGSDDIVIEASWGLGESIASGIVTPDRFVVGRKGDVKEANINCKSKGYFRRDGVNTLEDIDAVKAEERCADDDILKKIAERGLVLEQHFGNPQDIEWAMEAGEVYILQSRDITTLADGSERDGLLWTRGYGDEYWADPTTPLFFDIMGTMLTEYVQFEGARTMGYKGISEGTLIKLHKTRAYFNCKVLEKVFSYYPRFIRTPEILTYFPKKDQHRILEYPNDLRHMAMSQIYVAIRDRDGMMTRTDKAYKRWTEYFLNECKKVDDVDLSTLSDEELTALYDHIKEASLKHYRLIRYGMVSHSILPNLLIKSLLKRWLNDDGSIYSGLITGLPNNLTVETNIGYSDMAKVLVDNPEIRDRITSMPTEEFLTWMNTEENPLKEKYDHFMTNYGHRSNTREMSIPHWAEDPGYVLNMAVILSKDYRDLRELEAERRKERIALEERTYDRIRKECSGGHMKSFAVRRILHLAQKYLTFRENQRFYLDHILFRQRKLVLEYGRRFASRGLIEKEGDIWFVRENELFDVFRDGPDDLEAFKDRVSARVNEFETYKDALPPKFLRNGVDFDDIDDNVSGGLAGAASSPGSYKGVVRVVLDIEDLSMVKEGEILVTSNTDPGWTPVFSKLGGLITETGGILSHGAVISREYRIPAVTGVKDATVLLKTGQTVTVDGSSGRIIQEVSE